jgi:alpha-1,3-rhamnosyltransferase
MKNNPLVSVIIPAYNHEMYIEEALQSVINQTYKNIQFIVIDDGSTDRTAEIIEKFIKNNPDKNIQFIRKQNEGVCKTLNRGLALATGDYIA